MSTYRFLTAAALGLGVIAGVSSPTAEATGLRLFQRRPACPPPVLQDCIVPMPVTPAEQWVPRTVTRTITVTDPTTGRPVQMQVRETIMVPPNVNAVLTDLQDQLSTLDGRVRRLEQPASSSSDPIPQ